uniref:glycosyltransferase family 4 protein n=1 Tax=Lachnospira eligens TaxID=39485 RepID=UPI0040265492
MKILWLCNIVLPELCEEFGFRTSYAGGWLSGMWNELRKDSKIELAVCVPIKDKKYAKDGEYIGYKYYSFQWQAECEGQLEQIIRFKEIIESFNPDIIHIWGTEYIQTNSMIKACCDKGIIERVIINIQGLLYKYTEQYTYGMRDGYSDKILNSMLERQVYEIESLSMIHNVSGRTEWDKLGVLHINSKVNYYHCGEILRESFYHGLKWSYDACEKNTILISQASYPIKGFHLIIKYLARLRDQYPALKVKVCGKSPLDDESEYKHIISELIIKYNMENIILFVGAQDEKEMLKEYLNTSVFLSPSLIENSSNSVCEALALGVPVISSCVGGMESIVNNFNNGLMYNLGEEEKIVEYISMIFDNRSIAEKLSDNAVISSKKLNGKQECSETLKSIYNTLYQSTANKKII